MIPKIAHFHWVGKPMNWLRWQSIRTFEKFHPDYEIRIIRTPDDIAAKVENYAHQADWSWYRALATTGGWQIATDVVFVGRIPDHYNDADMCVCTNGTKSIYQFAAMGAKAGSEFFKRCEERCAKTAERDELEYQTLGVDMLRGMVVPSREQDAADGRFLSRDVRSHTVAVGPVRHRVAANDHRHSLVRRA